jgi:hypothetical protein
MKRVAALEFEIAVSRISAATTSIFGDMESYFRAKRKLFEG